MNDEGTRGHADTETRDAETRDTEMKESGDPEKRDEDSHEIVTRLRVPASPRPPVSASPRHGVPASAVWRVFCAVEIPEKVSALAARHVNKLQTDFPRTAASWNRDGRFHLTLKFLGSIPVDRVDDLSRAAGSATACLSEFKIIIAGAGAFPKHGPPRVIWLGIEDPEGKLSQLQQLLEDECAALGFERVERPFHPHLTLARLRKPEGAKQLALAHRQLGFDSVQLTVSELLVMRSELSPNGSKHSELSKHCLTGSPD